MIYSGTTTWKTDINTTYSIMKMARRLTSVPNFEKEASHGRAGVFLGWYLQVELRHLVAMLGNLMESPLTSARPLFPEKIISPLYRHFANVWLLVASLCLILTHVQQFRAEFYCNCSLSLVPFLCRCFRLKPIDDAS